MAHAGTEFPGSFVRVVVEPGPAVRRAVDGHAGERVPNTANGRCRGVVLATVCFVTPWTQKCALLKHKMTIHTPRPLVRATAHGDAVVADEARVGARYGADAGRRGDFDLRAGLPRDEGRCSDDGVGSNGERNAPGGSNDGSTRRCRLVWPSAHY